MIWGPFVLAILLGLLVSAGLYFAYLWPQVEPHVDAPPGAPDLEATATTVTVAAPADVEATVTEPVAPPEPLAPESAAPAPATPEEPPAA